MEEGPRLCLVGYGRIAPFHLQAFRSLGATVTACCNRSGPGRARAVEEGGIPGTYGTLSEMIDREHPDGILVTAGISSIFGLGRDLIPLGIPLLLEKPPGLSAEETRTLAQLAEKHGTTVMVGLNRRFYSVYHGALERMGGVESVTSVSVEWSEDIARMREVGHPEELLPLMAVCNSLHGVDLLTFFAGEIPRAAVWGRNLDPSGKTLRWQMGLDGVSSRGARAHFDSNWDVPGRWRLVVDAPEVRMVSAPLESALLLRRGRPPEEILPAKEDKEFKAGFTGQARAFLNLIKDGGAPRWPACGLREAGLSMEMAEQMTRRCLQGRREIS